MAAFTRRKLSFLTFAIVSSVLWFLEGLGESLHLGYEDGMIFEYITFLSFFGASSFLFWFWVVEFFRKRSKDALLAIGIYVSYGISFFFLICPPWMNGDAAFAVLFIRLLVLLAFIFCKRFLAVKLYACAAIALFDMLAGGRFLLFDAIIAAGYIFFDDRLSQQQAPDAQITEGEQ